MTPAGTNLLLASADATPAPVDVVTKSLRFNAGDNAYLSRTPSAGNRTAWTFSTWVKRAELGTRQIIFACRVSTARFYLEFTSGNTIEVSEWTGSAYSLRLITSAVYRDVGGWYHLVFKYDSTPSTPDSTSVSLYVNGEQVTSFSTATYPSQNVTTSINAAALHTIGERADLGGSNYDGYLADVNFIDGTALTPTSFAEEDATTGQWEPKAFSGTYGTNGFHLDFNEDGATSGSNAGIGKDVSGNGNYFTTTNLAASDVVNDTPTDNYCVMNPLDSNSNNVLSEGNLNFSSSGSSGHYPTFSTMGMRSGKWYWEMGRFGGNNIKMAIMSLAHDSGSLSMDSTVGNSISAVNKVGYGFSCNDGAKAHNTTYDDTYGSALGTVLMCAFDADNGKIWWGKDGTWFDSGDPAAGTDYAFDGIDTDTDWGVCIHCYSGNLPWMNFGADPTFGGNVSTPDTSEFKHTPPTGFSALSTGNLPTPTIAKPAEHFNTLTYASSGAKTGVGFQPDLVWVKARGNAYDHELTDSVRGVTKALSSNATNVESTDSTGLTAFGTDGFTVGAGTNYSTSSMVAWSWKKSATAGFNIVGWTGDDDGFSGGTQAVAHGLGVAPEMVIAKNRTDEAGGSGNWIVYHKDTTSGDLLKLNTTDGEFTPNSTLIGSIGSTNVSFGNDSFDYEYLNSDNSFGSGTPDTYIGYFFASVEGYSKCGSINSSSSSAFCFLGFRPSFILAKRSDATGGNWLMFDDKRDGYNVDNDDLMANSSAVEATTDHIDILSNGFKIRTSDADLNGGTLIYLAVAKNPFKYASAR